jgi:hypothetical protein
VTGTRQTAVLCATSISRNVRQMIDGGAERHGVGAFHPLYGCGGHEAVTDQHGTKRSPSLFGQSGYTRFESAE